MRYPAQSAYLVRAGMLSFAAVTATACGGPPSQPVTESGFYRHDNEATVFRVDIAAKTVCAVISMPQMDAFGGFKQVHTVSPSTDIVGGAKVRSCPWPDGNYRSADGTALYRLTGGTAACRAVGGAPKNSITVPADVDVLAGRTLSGNCPR